MKCEARQITQLRRAGCSMKEIARQLGCSTSTVSKYCGAREIVRRPRLLISELPEGRLDLGHYLGRIANYVAAQDDHECFLSIADLRALAEKPQKASIDEMRFNVRETALDYLAAGLDPEKSTIYLQSAVGSIYEISRLLDLIGAKSDGLLVADILLASAHGVPVTQDNEARIGAAREIAQRFNYLYGRTFREPEAVHFDLPTLKGTDGLPEMRKSLGNAIMLSDDPLTVSKKIRGAHPDSVFDYHDAFNSNKQEVEDLKARYRAEAVGCVEIKEKCVVAVNSFLDPIRAQRIESEKIVDEVIYQGTLRVKQIAADVLRQMKKAMGLTGHWNQISRTARARSVESRLG